MRSAAPLPGALIDTLVEVYHRHFTHGEVRELLAFNQTPLPPQK